MTRRVVLDQSSSMDEASEDPVKAAIKQSLAQRIPLARGRAVMPDGRRMSQREAARRVGISQPGFFAIEHGETCPELPTIVSIAKTLGVSVGWLLGEDVSQEEVDAGRWWLNLPEGAQTALSVVADQLGHGPPKASASTDVRPLVPGAVPAPPASPPEPEAAPRPRRESTRMRKAG